ncbi:hypothetical protein PENTCL1PPCAC_23255 [Pristionchus entomophagus]|uniref:F-box domain-containing protein n=1 Tax=Pristionchus entomophagus TaxID=358040 RepID=A0AAV5U2I5_9BILA|nr:hypothetical protein PENTCL1PPCAC_23255 [Pristionchus entomophagus]
MVAESPAVMNELDLPPVFDFGSFPTEKRQALRLDFVTEKDAIIVNVKCKTKKECSLEGITIDESSSSVPLDRLVSHINSLKLRKTAKLSIVVMETREEWERKIVFALRKLLSFVFSDLPIVQLELNAIHWSLFSELRMEFYSTFRNLHELVFLPDQIPEDHKKERDRMIEFRTLLFEWLPRIKSTLRCLRIFTYLRLDSYLDDALKGCTKLETITIGKLYRYSDHPEFYSIRYVDFDGQGMAYSADDLDVALRVRIIFPNARVFRVVRYSVDVVKTLINALSVAGGVFDVYSDIYEIDHLRNVMGSTLRMELVEGHSDMEEAYVEMIGRSERYSTTIHFYNHRQRRYIE